jgi:LysM repeat protein
MSAPTRPSGGTRSTPQTGLLEPVLEPVRDGLSVPPATHEYTVAKGDTLSGIARKQGVPLNDLLAANGLGKSSTIYVGQTLQIPSAKPADETAVAELEHSGKEYVVGKGDTLGAIAARSGTTVKALKALNGLTSDTIFVGQKLALPETATLVQAPAPVQPAAPSAPAPVALAGQSSYVVQPGDTPSGIARKFGITSAQLMAANNISDPRKLVVGKTLVVPASGQAGGGTAAPSTRTASSTTSQPSAQPPAPAPTPEDPMSVLEALEDEDLPFVEVEVVKEPGNPGN